MGAESGFQLTKISLVIFILSALVNSKSKTQYRNSLSGSFSTKVSQFSPLSPIRSTTWIKGLEYNLLLFDDVDDVAAVGFAELEVLELSEALFFGSDVHGCGS